MVIWMFNIRIQKFCQKDGLYRSIYWFPLKIQSSQKKRLAILPLETSHVIFYQSSEIVGKRDCQRRMILHLNNLFGFRVLPLQVQGRVKKSSESQFRVVKQSAEQCSTVQNSDSQWRAGKHSAGQCRTVHNSELQCRTVKHSAGQCRTVKHSAGHCRARKHSAGKWRAVKHSAGQ